MLGRQLLIPTQVTIDFYFLDQDKTYNSQPQMLHSFKLFYQPNGNFINFNEI